MQINPNADSNLVVGLGRKVVHATGLRRWQSKSGTPMISMGFVVLQDLEQDSDDKGTTFIERFAETPNAIFRIANWAKATGRNLRFDSSKDKDMSEIMSMGPVKVTIVEDNYGDRTGTQIGTFNRFRGTFRPEWRPVIEQAAEAFAAKSRQIAEERGGYVEETGATAYSDDQGVEEDIPF